LAIQAPSPAEKELYQRRAARQFPALIVTGPRRAGKITPDRLLEDPDVVARIRTDPRAFMQERPGTCTTSAISRVSRSTSWCRPAIDGSFSSSEGVYRPQGEAVRLWALRPGVQAGDLERFLTLIGR
jgi:hypothetical protein